MGTLIKLISSILFITICSFFYLSCSEKEMSEISASSLLETALQQAGKNRAELEKVLLCYQANPADSLKYKAACFLIENMPYYTYYKGKLLEQYLTYYNLLLESNEKKLSLKY